MIGYPLSHSLSPLMHNAVIEKLNLNYVYIPFEIEPDSLRVAVKGLFKSGVKGLNVTIPHKVAVIKILDELDESARLIGAVNTILIKKGSLKGYNTDADGFLESLKEKGVRVRGKKVLLIGAGGAGRAICYALIKAGSKQITIVNRNLKKAKSLLKSFSEFNSSSVLRTDKFDIENIEKELIPQHQLIVNATSLGMKNANPLEIDFKRAQKHTVVCDIIYNPPLTGFLKGARKRGLKTIDGTGMLVHQGAISFKLWTGISPPVDVMRKALKSFL